MEPAGTSPIFSQVTPQEQKAKGAPKADIYRHDPNPCRVMGSCRGLLKWLAGCISLSLLSCSHPTNIHTGQNQRPDYNSFHEQKADEIDGYPVSVSTSGSRPILLLHELNGQSPGCFTLGKEMSDAGCKVYIPRFYGHAGQDTPAIKVRFNAAFRKEWNIFRTQGGTVHESMPRIVESIQRRHPGQKITVIGNCMTGGQALALLAEPSVETVVVCQPASPLLPLIPGMHRHFGIPRWKLAAGLVALRDHSWKNLVSIHYRSDPVAPFLRTEYLGLWTLEEGCADRHAILVGLRPGQRSMSRLSTTHPGWKRLDVHPGTAPAHPTVTSALPADREVFRTALFEALHLERRSAQASVSHKAGHPSH